MADAPRITAHELHDLLDRDAGIIPVDVRRDSWNRSEEKIRGAVRIDPDRYRDELDSLIPGASVATYCTCPNEGTSGRVASYLNENGYEAKALVGGFDSWVEAGFETEPKDGSGSGSDAGADEDGDES